jgi:hypothetical protein
MSANVHIIDQRRFSAGNFEHYASEARSMAGAFDNVAFQVNAAWSIDRICRRSLELSRNQIGLLRICCHGNSSYLQLGTEVRIPEDVYSFRLLRGCWVGDCPRIELDACGVLSNTPVACPPQGEMTVEQWQAACTGGTIAPTSAGYSLAQALADVAGILVVASYDVQWAPASVGFEGRIRYFRPATYYRHDGADPRA